MVSRPGHVPSTVRACWYNDISSNIVIQKKKKVVLSLLFLAPASIGLAELDFGSLVVACVLGCSLACDSAGGVVGWSHRFEVWRMFFMGGASGTAVAME